MPSRDQTRSLMGSKGLWILALLVVFSLSIGSAGCPRQHVDPMIPPCPTPTSEAIESLSEDDVPMPVLTYLIDLDMYCNMIDVIRE